MAFETLTVRLPMMVMVLMMTVPGSKCPLGSFAHILQIGSNDANITYPPVGWKSLEMIEVDVL